MDKHINIIKEACVENFNQAFQAQSLGASRIELCSDLYNSGTTPSYGTVKLCKEKLSIPIHCIIRPRKGNFVYDNNDMQIMLNDINLLIKECHIDGIVIGAVTKADTVDMKAMKSLIDKAKELNPKINITFHMAFDELSDSFKAIDEIIALGCNRILTKGGKFRNAVEGKDALNKLFEYAKGRIVIMPGRGVTKDNYITEIINHCSQCTEVHGTKIVGMLN